MYSFFLKHFIECMTMRKKKENIQLYEIFKIINSSQTAVISKKQNIIRKLIIISSRMLHRQSRLNYFHMLIYKQLLMTLFKVHIVSFRKECSKQKRRTEESGKYSIHWKVSKLTSRKFVLNLKFYKVIWNAIKYL